MKATLLQEEGGRKVFAIVFDKGEPSVHAHVVVGKRDGTTMGGHLIDGRVWPTLEVIVSESPRHLQKRFDPATGLSLISPERTSA